MLVARKKKTDAMFPHLASIGFAGPSVELDELESEPDGGRAIDVSALLKASRQCRLPQPKMRQDDTSRPRRVAVERCAEYTQELYRAAKDGNMRQIRHCLNRGAQVNSLDAFFNTPLHLAAGGGHVPAVKLLLEFGALRTAVNKMGHTPADRAAINDHPVVVKVLQTAGYSEVHKRREFVRNLVRGGAVPSAEDVIKYSGGSTDAGASADEAKRRLAAGPPLPPMMTRLLTRAGFVGTDDGGGGDGDAVSPVAVAVTPSHKGDTPCSRPSTARGDGDGDGGAVEQSESPPSPEQHPLAQPTPSAPPQRRRRQLEYKPNVHMSRFVRGMMHEVPLERPGDPSVREVYRRFGADFVEYLRMKEEAKRTGKDLKAMAQGEYDPDAAV